MNGLNVILNVQTGSVVKGLSDENSDLDTRGVFVEDIRSKLDPFKQRPGFERSYKVFDPSNGKITDNDLWELSYFIQLLKEGNPLLLSMFYSPTILTINTFGQELIDARNNLISPNIINGLIAFTDIKLRAAERQFQKTKKYANWYKYFLHIFSTIDETEQVLATSRIVYPLDNPLLREIKFGDKPFSFDELKALYLEKRNVTKSLGFNATLDVNWLTDFTYRTYVGGLL